MGNVTALKTKPKLPDDLPEILRSLANEVESGAITDMVIGYVANGDYKFLWPSSLVDSLVLCDLAHSMALDRMQS